MSTKIFRLLKNKFNFQKLIGVPAFPQILLELLLNFPYFPKLCSWNISQEAPLVSITTCKMVYSICPLLLSVQGAPVRRSCNCNGLDQNCLDQTWIGLTWLNSTQRALNRIVITLLASTSHLSWLLYLAFNLKQNNRLVRLNLIIIWLLFWLDRGWTGLRAYWVPDWSEANQEESCEKLTESMLGS
jgi:hypothetical protein